MLLPLLLLATSLSSPQSTPPSGVTSTDVAPGSAEPAIDAGLKAFRQRRLRQAESEFQKAVDADPKSPAAHFYLGYTYYKMGEPTRRMNDNKERAKQEFEKAFELDPLFKPVWGAVRVTPKK
jgi:Tfp pilus assembly protein PilF